VHSAAASTHAPLTLLGKLTGGASAEGAAEALLEQTFDGLFQAAARLVLTAAAPAVTVGGQAAETAKAAASDAPRFGSYQHPGKASVGAGKSWRRALFEYLEASAAASSSLSSSLSDPRVFHEDADCVVVYDGFPKATVHLLVIPKVRVRFVPPSSKTKPHSELESSHPVLLRGVSTHCKPRHQSFSLSLSPSPSPSLPPSRVHPLAL